MIENIEINISLNSKEYLEWLFDMNEVYVENYDEESQTIGYVDSGSSYGTIYYYMECVKQGNNFLNKVTKDLINIGG